VKLYPKEIKKERGRRRKKKRWRERHRERETHRERERDRVRNIVSKMRKTPNLTSASGLCKHMQACVHICIHKHTHRNVCTHTSSVGTHTQYCETSWGDRTHRLTPWNPRQTKAAAVLKPNLVDW